MKRILAKLKKVIGKPSIKAIDERLAVLFSFSMKLLILISIIVMVVLFIQALIVPQTFTINPISVPDDFESKGYSSQVLGSRLTDKLTDIVKIGSEQLEILESDIISEDEKQTYNKSADISSFNIQVGLFEISLTEIVNFLREKLGNKNVVIESDLTEENSTLTFSMRLKSNGELIKYNRVEESFTDDPDDKFRALNELIEKAGEFIISYNDPVILLSYFISEKRGEVSDSVFRMVTYDDYFDDEIKVWTYVIWGHTLYSRAEEIYFNTFVADTELYESALSKYHKALETEPEFVTSIGWNMASYYIDNQKYRKANDIYKRILAIDKKNIDAHYFKAENYNIIDQKEDAVRSYGKVTRLEPDSEKGLDALMKIATIYKNDDKNELAKIYFKKVFRNENADKYNLASPALIEYADLLTKEEEYKMALAYYVKALKYDREVNTYLKIAESYAHLGDAVAFVNYLKFAIDDGFELTDSILNTPVYSKYKDNELMRFLIKETFAKDSIN